MDPRPYDIQRKAYEQAILLEFYDILDPTLTIPQLQARVADFFIRKFKLNNISTTTLGEFYATYNTPQFRKIAQGIDTHVTSMNTMFTTSSIKKDFLLKLLVENTNYDTGIIALPLLFEKEFLGTFILYSPDIIYVREAINLITELLKRYSRTISYIKKLKSAEYDANTDQLTGLYNKAYFFELIEDHLARAQQENKPTSIIMFDLDNFKHYNDTNGHPAGDKLLKEIGALLRERIPRLYTTARYGGEEFIILLPDIKQNEAYHLAEDLRTEAEHRFEKTTFSIGTVTCLNSSLSTQAMINKADQALYKAKNTGKNKVISKVIIDKALQEIDITDVRDTYKY